MMERVWQRPSVRYAAVAVGIAYLFYLAVMRPYTFGMRNITLALGVIGLGFLAAGFETYFLPILLGVFFSAGSILPIWPVMQQVRWPILILGAVLSLAYYARYGRGLSFNALHLLSVFAVLTALASTFVSYVPMTTLLKACSLASLFIYGSVGIRTLCHQRPERLVNWLVRFAEVMVVFTAVVYFVFSYTIWDNPNSLGMIAGVLCWPVCLWWFLLGSTTSERVRRGFVLFLCAALLFSSASRAAMLGAAVASVLLLTATKRYRVMLVGAFLAATFLAGVYVLAPERLQSTSERLIYKKGEMSEGILKSRQEPWEKSMNSFGEHPWLGTGFGVSKESADYHDVYSSISRERGSSYLTLLEGTGLVGVLSFGVLLATLLWHCFRVLFRLRTTGHSNYLAAPVAGVLLAGLVAAGFEDWLFAVGYYGCLAFWLLAMSLPDLTSHFQRAGAAS
jgi:hypothetical protein